MGEPEQSKRWEIAWIMTVQGKETHGRWEGLSMSHVLYLLGFDGENALGGLVCIRGRCPKHK